MNRTAPEAPVTTTVSGLSDRHLVQRLKELAAVEHQLEVVVIDHLRELERRRLYLPQGFSSLFDYATRELGYSEAAAWRRIKAMRLCGEVEGARERMRDGSLTLNSAALLQHAFDRQERKRKQSGSGRGARAGDRSPAPSNGSAPGPDAQADARSAVASNGSAPGPGAPPREPSAPAQAEEPPTAPVLDSSARRALVEEAAGKSTRQVKNLLAGVDPDLTVPADRIRPLGAGRWELKAVIDDECRLGLDQLKGLLSHVDPHMTLGQIVARAVKEAVERHDPARPPRGRRTGSRAASSGANETSAPKDASGPDEAAHRRVAPVGGATSAAKVPADFDQRRAVAAKRASVATQPSAPKVSTGPNAVVAEPAQRKTAPAGVTASAAKEPGNPGRGDAATAKRPGAATPPSAPKEPGGPDSVAPPARPAAMPARVATSPAKVKADSEHGRAAAAKRPATAARSATSAPKAECARQGQAAPPQPQVRGRTIPAAIKRQVWERDGGCCSYVDRRSGRRCGSRHVVQMDHVLPFALGGSAEPGNLRLLCAAHHRHRHADEGGWADRAAARP